MALSDNDMALFSLTCRHHQDVGMWLEEINLGSYRQIFKENGVNGEYLEGMSMFTTEQILRFIRRCHMKWGDFITLCKELRRIKGAFCDLSWYSCTYKLLVAVDVACCLDSQSSTKMRILPL